MSEEHTGFDEPTLELFRDAIEVQIETRRASGAQQQTIIWIVADEHDAYVRSVNGEAGWWYRHARARPEAAILVDGRHIPVRAEPASDEATVERVSELLREKYGRRYRGDTEAMIKPHTLPTTLRLVPA